MALELVYWRDHWSRSTGWVDKDDLVPNEFAPHTCETVGWVVHEDDDVLVLCTSRSDKIWRMESCILKVCIISRHVIDQLFWP